MIIKNTPWEKRNLGVESSIEYYVNEGDTWNEIVDDIKQHDEEYQVMHIASGNTDVLLNAVGMGFFLIEMNIQLAVDVNKVVFPEIYRRFENKVTCELSTEEEKGKILSAIEKGNMFSTDKVARDPYFGVDYAGRRYAYWTKDKVNQGAYILSMKYKEKLVAFDVLFDAGNGIGEAFLGGVLPEYRNSGLGFIGVYHVAKYAQKLGYKKIITGVSSNNLSILKLHELFGYTVESASYCMIKHLD